jgi:hypothetical protein
LYVEFREKIRQAQLEDYMKTMKATEVMFDTFSAKTKNQVSTYDDECAKTLFTIQKKSNEPGWSLVVVGVPSVEPKAPAEPSVAEFLAQEREDLLVQEEVMRDDPEAFQHDGGYAGPILGKQKMAGRAGSPLASGIGERKRQRGSILAMMHAELGNLVIQEEELDELAAENEELKTVNSKYAARISEISAENEELKKVNGKNAAKIGEISAEKDSMENDFRHKKEKMAARINDISTEKVALANETGKLHEELNRQIRVSDQDKSALVSKNKELERMLQVERGARKAEKQALVERNGVLATRNTLMKARVETLLNGWDEPVGLGGVEASGCLPDIGLIVVRDGNCKKKSWVVRYRVVAGAVQVTGAELTKAYNAFRPVGYQTVTVGNVGYALFMHVNNCSMANLASLFDGHFGADCFMEVLDSTCYDKFVSSSQKHLSWREQMFNPFIAKLVQMHEDGIDASGWPVGAGL